jgi:predicted class III extradiol MEMO1 family dioxygenase
MRRKIRARTRVPSTDFEHLGYETALQSRDQTAAEQICGLHIHAFADELQPEISDLDGRIDTNLARTRALYSHIYDRPLPVSDAAL